MIRLDDAASRSARWWSRGSIYAIFVNQRKHWDQIPYWRVFLRDFARMVNIGPGPTGWEIDLVLEGSWWARYPNCSHFFSASLLAKAGLLERHEIYRWNLAKLLWLFWISSRENFQPKLVVQDKQIITAIGFAHQEFARKDSKSRVGREYGQLF